MTRSARRTKLVTVAIAAMTLAGCSVHPGMAAKIGSTTITDGHVAEVAQALCSANTAGAQSGDSRAVASRGALQGALQVLLDSELSRMFGEAKNADIDHSKVEAALTSNEQGIAALPAAERDTFRTALKEYAEGQLMLIDLGRKSLTAQGTAAASVTDDQAIAEGSRLRDTFAKSLEIDVSPRYGTFSNGVLEAKSGSLSVPVSQGAVEGAKPGPSAAWVSALPASQQCG